MENSAQPILDQGMLATWYPQGIFIIPEKGDKTGLPLPIQKAPYLALSNESVQGANLELLSGIFQACKIPMQDVNILQWDGKETYPMLLERTGPGFILLFGVTPAQIDLPLVFPDFQTQPFGGVTWVCAPELGLLQQDKLMKSKLWLCLKQAFSL